MTESEILKSIVQYLKSINIFHWRNNTGAWKKGSGWIKYGDPGSPDIICIINGYFVGFEVKREGEKLRSEQIEWQVRCTMAGGYYFRVTSVEDVCRALDCIDD